MPVQRLGAAYLQRFDLVIGALDNREARVWVNQACRKLGKSWIDGAIEGLRGLARMFAPEGACYECTLTEADYKQMSHRRSCSLLAPEEIISGKTPTNATTASIIAGVQTQETIKFLVGQTEMLGLVGKCWVFTGDTMDAYTTRYREDEECMAHDYYDRIEVASDAVRLGDLLELNHGFAHIDALDFEEDLIELQPCADCGGDSRIRTRSSMSLGEGLCPTCSKPRLGNTLTSLAPEGSSLDLDFANLGLGLEDFVTLRSGAERIHVVVKGS
jgi:adenylyltransferase/sulfurtransferase